jgi:AcrR family transcriptional regulator
LKKVKLETIVDAAYKVFFRYGYQKTSMDDIAKEAMIGKGTIYYYFSTKEEIFIEVLKRVDAEIVKKLRKKIAKAETFHEKLKVFFTEPFKHIETTPHHALHVWDEESPVFLTKLKEFKSNMVEVLKKILYEIFLEAKEQGVLNIESNKSLENTVEVVFRWFTMGIEYVKVYNSIESVKSIINDYIYLSDIFVTGLIKKEAIK